MQISVVIRCSGYIVMSYSGSLEMSDFRSWAHAWSMRRRGLNHEQAWTVLGKHARTGTDQSHRGGRPRSTGLLPGAERLNLCVRQISRSCRRYEAGPAGLVSGKRGKTSATVQCGDHLWDNPQWPDLFNNENLLRAQ